MLVLCLLNACMFLNLKVGTPLFATTVNPLHLYPSSGAKILAFDNIEAVIGKRQMKFLKIVLFHRMVIVLPMYDMVDY